MYILLSCLFPICINACIISFFHLTNSSLYTWYIIMLYICFKFYMVLHTAPSTCISSLPPFIRLYSSLIIIVTTSAVYSVIFRSLLSIRVVSLNNLNTPIFRSFTLAISFHLSSFMNHVILLITFNLFKKMPKSLHLG